MSTLFLLFVLAQGTTVAPIIVEDGPHNMTAREIRAYNAPLDRKDPAYIRCKSEVETGSLVRSRSICRTNRQWNAAEDAGNQEARDVIDHTRSKSWNTSG